MREDIYEPLARYRDEFKEKFARIAAEKFEELKNISGVDIQANALLVSRIRKLEANRRKAANSRELWASLGFLFILGALAGAGIICFAFFTEDPYFVAQKIKLLSIGAALLAVTLLLLFKWSLPAQFQAEKKIRELTEQIEQKTREAWEQMASLNALFDWHITAELIEKTVPRIQFDRFFNEARLRDLRESFGWDDSFNADRSVIHTHSCVINDNPFVFAELLRQEWQEKIYTGHLEISWTETIRDFEGKVRTVKRYQTLTATVSKPAPYYLTDKLLIYGNDAAPDLDFSREPSDLSGEKSGLWNSIKRSHRMGKLKKFARNLDDDSDFTMMSNEEFELLFHAKDRNDEVGFRLLFTPLAQQQMVDLLNDKTVGFGDDFHFLKDNKLNYIFASHLHNINFSHDPARFKGYEFKTIKKFFLQYNEDFFKAVYFALAPLLIIPLYQQTRTHKAIYGEKESSESAFWEHEALANYYGDSHFEHPDCITQNILKARCIRRQGNSGTVEVTAHGFCGEQRVDFVNVYGGDGHWHAVPVEWVEYLPVQRTSFFKFTDDPSPEEADPSQPDSLLRRSIYSWLSEK